MPRAIEVRTGARLHFGPFASGAESGRCFGGIGMMIASPGLSFRAVEHDTERFIGCSAETSERIRKLRESWNSALNSSKATDSPLSWEFDTAPAEHCGFGTGTQLSLAVAAVLALREGDRSPDLSAIARRCGRGRRSAIGLHGFAQGGFLVDAGQAGQGALGELAVRLPVPEAWRIVTLQPRHSGQGLSGACELAAFEALPPMAPALTDRLCRLTLMEILPALQAADCGGFGSAVAEYGRVIGDYFCSVQGGILADPRVRALAQHWPSLGQQLVQSSWGPGVALFAPTQTAAEEWHRDLKTRLPDKEWLITLSPPLNHGATIRAVSV